MIVNAVNLKGMFVNLLTLFNKAFEGAPTIWNQIAMHVISTSRANDYGWLSGFPKMREWIGEKYFKRLEAFGYTITNKPFEATVEVRRDDIDDDNLGIYGAQASAAGESARQWPDELVLPLVSAGFTKQCFDSQYYFDTDHPIGENDTYSNKGTKVLKVGTLAEAEASYGVAVLAIKGFKDAEGRSLNLVPDTLLVPPALEVTAKLLVEAEKYDNNQPNPYRNTVKVLVDARLTSATAWFLLVTKGQIKPFIFQERKKPKFVSQTNPEADDVFNKAVYKYGVESRGNAGYGLPQLAYGSDGTV